jgi:hypothetical protein
MFFIVYCLLPLKFSSPCAILFSNANIIYNLKTDTLPRAVDSSLSSNLDSIDEKLILNLDYIVYRFPSIVDSLLISKLDSIDEELVNSNNLVIDIYTNNEKIEDYHPYNHLYGLSFRLISIQRSKKEVNYIRYLAENSNRYYVSSNKRYKIPVIYILYDELFKYDDKTYPNKTLNCRILYVIDYVENFAPERVRISLNKPIPTSLLKETLK